MAATKTSRNDTPNTPNVDESKIARMKVDDLRRKLKDRGVKGTADLKKPELVKKMIKLETAGSAKSKSKSPSASTRKSSSASASSSSSTSSAGSTSGSASASGKKSASAKKSVSASAKKSVSASARTTSAKSSAKGSSAKKNPTSRNDTPNTPNVDESKIARMKVDDLRRELKSRGVKGTADLKKPELVKKLIKASTSSAGSSSSPSSSASPSWSAKTESTGGKGGTKGSGGKRTGKATSDSLKYAQEIKSTADKPEREGRSLVTTDHEVIRQWAKARKAVPATIEGTEHDGHLGVLRLDFPGYSGDRLTQVSWDDWFDAFDKRRLNFIYQQKQTSGKRSNFFRLENPDE
jgi:hypothetical protein